MKNMRVKQKLIVSFLGIAVITAVVGIVGVMGLLSLNANEDKLYSLSYNATVSNNLVTNLGDQRIAYRDAVLYMDEPSKRDSAISQLNSLDKEYQEMCSYLEKSLLTEKGRSYLVEFNGTYQSTFQSMKAQLLEAISAGDEGKAHQLLSGLAEPANIIKNAANGLVEYATQVCKDTNDNDSKSAYTMVTILAALAVIAVASAMALGLYLARQITAPLLKMKDVMDQVGNTGYLTFTEENKRELEKAAVGKDEIAQSLASSIKTVQHIEKVSAALQQVADGDLGVQFTLLSDKDTIGISLRKMLDNLNAMFGEIRMASDQVSAGAGQVSQGAQGLASGSSEQAASIEEFSATLTEMQEKTNLSAENSSKAREANNQTAKRLEDSIRSMNQMLEAMKAIDESSSSITKVIKVIDDIAFQTNILALNAAVEAARAGQHGKGFAVVADEVRNLASKSADAAKETASLIEGSTVRVQEGNQIVAKTNADLDAAAENARESTRLIERVATESVEQARSIAEIHQGIEQIATVVQANSATAEQSAAAAQEMSAQAVVLNEIVSRFKIAQTSDLPTYQSGERQETSGFALTSGGKY